MLFKMIWSHSPGDILYFGESEEVVSRVTVKLIAPLYQAAYEINSVQSWYIT